MRQRISILAMLTTLVLAGTSGGCSSRAPELDWIVLVPPGNPDNATGFCKPNTHVVFVVKNQGRTPAPLSRARVTFGETDAPQFVNVDALAPGQASQVFEVPIPPGCFQSDCHFRITANADQLLESDTANNTRDGSCIG